MKKNTTSKGYGSIRYSWITAVFFLILMQIFCRPANTRAAETEIARYMSHLGDGFRYSFRDPEWLLVAGGIAALSPLDKTIKARYQYRLMPAAISRSADCYGRGINIILANIYATSHGAFYGLAKKERLKQIGLINEAFAVNLAITGILKYAVRRERPDGCNRYSFPSGHASSSFTVAATLYTLYGKRVGIPAYLFAAVTGLQRIHSNKHWFSDVCTGALLGTLIGRGFATLHNEGKKQNHETAIMFNCSIRL